MTREEMIGKLLWNSGGMGFGICSVAASMIWDMDRPTPDKPDYPSILAVNGPSDLYTDEELEKLVAFGDKITARYDTYFKYRRGANLTLIGKTDREDGMWLRKKLSWTMGPMYSPSLDEAITLMTRMAGLQ